MPTDRATAATATGITSHAPRGACITSPANAKTLAKALRESSHGGQDTPTWQLQELSEQVMALTDEVRQLKETQEFDQKLLGSETSGVP